MASLDATLLPPVVSDDPQDRGSARRLDDVGVDTVMNAMREKTTQKKAVLALDMEDFEDTPRSQRVPAQSDGFLKVR